MYYVSQIPNGEEYKKAVDSSSTLRMLDRIDDFLSTHELQVSLPQELGTSVGQVKMPLVDQGHSSVAQQGRSKNLVPTLLILTVAGCDRITYLQRHKKQIFKQFIVKFLKHQKYRFIHFLFNNQLLSSILILFALCYGFTTSVTATSFDVL